MLYIKAYKRKPYHARISDFIIKPPSTRYSTCISANVVTYYKTDNWNNVITIKDTKAIRHIPFFHCHS